MAWNEERIASLAKLWGEGLSASQVARRLGGGATRNAVIGKVHRLGLAGRDAPAACRTVTGLPASRPRPRAVIASQAASARRVAPPPPPPVKPARADLEPTATLMALADGGCRWPIGDPGHVAFGFCGRDRDPNGPYCSGHARRAFHGTAKAAATATAGRAFDRWLSPAIRSVTAAGQ